MKALEIRFTFYTETSTAQRSSHGTYNHFSNDLLQGAPDSDKQAKKDRKTVEKLHRDRINSSIEQLKSLLGPEILNQQSDSKMEKADILEMTVCFLRQQQQYQPVSSSSC
ncbi:transcription factor HES-5-like [Salmo trutta]|uniref:transcription factor HES-5-like n=1 Tax=Salmo trutta TaxID=8032 RepID=UPI00112FF720|nr:transcription factor HES-5-like [Salmo trutta]